MEIALAIGTLMAWAVFFGSILVAPGAKLSAFVDYPSLVCVGGGAVSAVFMCFPLKNVLSLPKIMIKAFFPKTPDYGPAIKQIVQFAEIARRDGILALESKTAEISDPFLLMGIQMAVDGVEAELTGAILQSEVDAIALRHKIGKQILDQLVKYAPAFGMIGTLLGLIIMLGNMDDPAAIGPGMAVALLTTLYGAMVANMTFGPMGDKLAFYSRQELIVREIIIKGIQGIQAGDNPRMIEQKLLTYLPRAERGKIEDKKAA